MSIYIRPLADVIWQISTIHTCVLCGYLLSCDSSDSAAAIASEASMGNSNKHSWDSRSSFHGGTYAHANRIPRMMSLASCLIHRNIKQGSMNLQYTSTGPPLATDSSHDARPETSYVNRDGSTADQSPRSRSVAQPWMCHPDLDV